MISITTENILLAFKKLKSFAYYDKSKAMLRNDIALLDNKQTLTLIKSLDEQLNNASPREWSKYLDTHVLDTVSIFTMPKSLEDPNSFKDNEKKNETIISSISNEKPQITNCQYFIDLGVIGYLIGILWVMTFGDELDKCFSSRVYSNRIKRVQNNKGQSEQHQNIVAPDLFEPYFRQYESWRDTPLGIAQSIAQKGLDDAFLISFDIQRFFYNIKINEKEWQELFETFFSKDGSNNQAYKRLHDACFKIMKKYTDLYRKIAPETISGDFSIIPIGFPPSGIIANWCLQPLDNHFEEKITPIFYGRYVDDIMIVIKKEKGTYNSVNKYNQIKETLLEQFTERTNKNSLIISRTCLNTPNSELEIQNTKTRIFVFEAGAPQVLLSKIRKEIALNSSEFNLMPDIEGMEVNDSFEVIFNYQTIGSPNKLRDIQSIKLNKYELSKYLACLKIILPHLDDSQKHQLLDDLISIFSLSNLIDIYYLWETLFEIFVCTNEFSCLKRIITRINKAIEAMQIDNRPDDINSRDRKLSLKKSMQEHKTAALLRACSLSFSDRSRNIIDEQKVLASTTRSWASQKDYCCSNIINHQAIPLAAPLLWKIIFKNNITPNINLSNLDELMKLDWGNEKPTLENEILPYICNYEIIEFTLCTINIAQGKSLDDPDQLQTQVDQLFKNINGFNFHKGNHVKPIIGRIQQLPSVKNIEEQQEPFDKLFCICVGHNERFLDNRLRVAIGNIKLEENLLDKVLRKEKRMPFQRYDNIRRLAKEAIRHKANMLILPEASIPYSWIPLLTRFSKRNNITILCGIEHALSSDTLGKEKVYNLTAVILPFKIGNYSYAYLSLHQKTFFAPSEEARITDLQKTPIKGNRFELYSWRNIWFSVYCCFELASVRSRSLFSGCIDMLIAIEANRDVSYYSHLLTALSRDLSCYCVQVNDSTFGDSRIVRPSSSREMNILNIKGGNNSTILVDDIDIEKIRNAQQCDSGDEYKPPAPDFNHEAAAKKTDGTLFESITYKQETISQDTVRD